MKKVICTDDSNQPIGANAVKNESYYVEADYVNNLDQRVYMIKGLKNKGVTKLGMAWKGYNANRFSTIEDFVMEDSMVNEKELVLN